MSGAVCEQCHIFSISLVGRVDEHQTQRLLQAYHAFHRFHASQAAFSAASAVPSFRCLDCKTSVPPLLPRFLCVLCGGGRVVADTDPSHSHSAPSVVAVSSARGFLARLEGDVELDVLRETLRMNGIQAEFRAAAWRLLLRYDAAERSARDVERRLYHRKYFYWRARYCRSDSPLTPDQRAMAQQIAVDVPRTSCRSNAVFFDDPRLAEALSRVLLVWGVVCFERVGYFQGLNDLATPLFVLLSNGRPPADDAAMSELEADVLWCLALLLEPVMRATRGKMHAVEFTHLEEKLARAADPQLCAHLETLGIDWMFFAFKWNICLLSREFHLQQLFVLWDFYLVESEHGGHADFHPFVVVALVLHFRQQLLACGDTTEVLLLIQSLPLDAWGDRQVRDLIAAAVKLRLEFGHLCRLQLDDTRPVEMLRQRPLIEDFVVLK